jgi:CheY-like chemotaxis protein
LSSVRPSVTLACGQAQEHHRSSRQRDVTMPLHTSMTILLIDDEPSFVRALATLLRREDYTVDTADNGNLALALLEERRYDVILCDVRMPELDGPTFYAILTSQYPYLRQRVIFLTGDTLSTDSMAFLEGLNIAKLSYAATCRVPAGVCCDRVVIELHRPERPSARLPCL